MYDCEKRQVVAVLLCENGKVFVGRNMRANESPCLRKHTATATDYNLCESCSPLGHAEVDAIKQAGEDAAYGEMFVFGHTVICDDCINEISKHRIKAKVMKYGG